MQSRVLVAISACAITFSSFTAHAISVSGQGTWKSTLLARDLDGNPATTEAYYDTNLKITWLADANYAATQYANSGGTEGDSDGRLTWAGANTWATTLNPYGSGISGWRLPDTNPVDGGVYDYVTQEDGTSDKGYNISAPGTLYAGSTGSELAHMFYNTLGNIGYYDRLGAGRRCSPPDYCLSNTGPFSIPNASDSTFGNVPFWSATEYHGPTDYPTHPDAWSFSFDYGYQGFSGNLNFNEYAWAVHDGDMGSAVVPTLPSVWLFGSGLLGLGSMARRKKT